MSKLLTITRKVELRFNTPHREEINQHYRTLKGWRDIACNGANMIISLLYTGLKAESFTYLDKKVQGLRNTATWEELDYKEQKKLSKEEDQEIYKVINAEKQELFNYKTETTYYYERLTQYYNDLKPPSVILSCLANMVVGDFNTNKKDYLRHDQSLRTYKKNMPIPFTAQSIRNVRKSVNVEKDKEYKDFCFTLFGLPLRTNLGRDRSNNYFLLNEAFSEWFLPDGIWNIESQISELILKSRADDTDQNTNVHHLGAVVISISYKKQTDKEAITPEQRLAEPHRYIIHAELNGSPYNFSMKPMRPSKKADETEKSVKGYKIVSNYKLGDSKIQLVKDEQYDKESGEKKERTKIFLLASLQFEEQPWELDEKKIAYCELDPLVPLKVTIGTKTFTIGSKEEFMYRRLGIMGAYRNKQKQLKFEGGGRGRKHKLEALEIYTKYEKDVVSNKIHKYSAELIKICLENQCKYIYLRKPKVPDSVKTDDEKLLIRTWSYGQLDQAIEYKALKKRIELVREDIPTASAE
jgi:hypothetical protein